VALSAARSILPLQPKFRPEVIPPPQCAANPVQTGKITMASLLLRCDDVLRDSGTA
jgi:hypothetical protein